MKKRILTLALALLMTAALCTIGGGQSAEAADDATGSTGDGYGFARELGHTVTKIKPSLVPLESPDGFCPELAGFAPRHVTLTVLDGSGDGSCLHARIASEMPREAWHKSCPSPSGDLDQKACSALK